MDNPNSEHILAYTLRTDFLDNPEYKNKIQLHCAACKQHLHHMVTARKD